MGLTHENSIKQAMPLAGGYTVVFEFDLPDRLTIAITPHPAFTSREQVREFLAAYFEARTDFLRTVATVTGKRLAVVDELGGGVEAISTPIRPATRQ
jgi:hypothetical protein